RDNTYHVLGALGAGGGTWEGETDGRTIEEIVQWVESIPMLEQVTLQTLKGFDDSRLEPWSKFPARLQLEFPYAHGEP
ncbi:hypothetical protein FRC03_007686, partial [Tulasnella sp. 419]